MQFLLINVLDCLAISLFLYLLVDFRNRRSRGWLSYPPGPPSWPIIGNLLDVPKETPWSEYADMSKTYGRRNRFGGTGVSQLKPASQGNILCLRVLSEVVVVLGSYSVVKDLLEKRGEIHSDRPIFPIAEMYVLECGYLPISCHVDNPRFLGWRWIGPYL